MNKQKILQHLSKSTSYAKVNTEQKIYVLKYLLMNSFCLPMTLDFPIPNQIFVQTITIKQNQTQTNGDALKQYRVQSGRSKFLHVTYSWNYLCMQRGKYYKVLMKEILILR